MTDHGTVHDAPLVAVGRGLADVPASAPLVGVVRDPAAGFRAAVDENRPALGPPPELAAEIERRRRGLRMQGLCAEGAHNAAWEDVEFGERYAAHLDGAVGEDLDDLAARLDDGEDVVIVCDAESRRFRSHRTLVRERLAVEE